MIKLIVAILALGAIFAGGYYYGYRNGGEDARSNTNARSIDAQAAKYTEKLRQLEATYTDKDGNMVIPKVQWDALKAKEAEAAK